MAVIVIERYVTPAGYHGCIYKCPGCGETNVDRYALHNCKCREESDARAKMAGTYW